MFSSYLTFSFLVSLYIYHILSYNYTVHKLIYLTAFTIIDMFSLCTTIVKRVCPSTIPELNECQFI